MLMFTAAASGFVLQPVHTLRARGALMVEQADAPYEAPPMPEVLAEWGCEGTLWNGLPNGAHRDLIRFAGTGNEEFAKRRLLTMQEISALVGSAPGAAWDKTKWSQAVATWEAGNAADLAAAKKAEKAAKAAAAKAAREAAAEA